MDSVASAVQLWFYTFTDHSNVAMDIAAMKRQITQVASDLQKLKASKMKMAMEIANMKVTTCSSILALKSPSDIRVHSAIEALEPSNCQLLQPLLHC